MRRHLGHRLDFVYASKPFTKYAVKLTSFSYSNHPLRINDMIIHFRMEQKVKTFDGVEMGASRPGRVFANYHLMPFAFN